MFYVILILVIILIGYIFLRKKLKKLRLDNLVMVNGGVKTGKTTLQVYLAIKTWKQNHKHYRRKKFFYKLFNKKKLSSLEEPLLYSNIPLKKVPYVPLTLNLILRKERFNYKSVCLISETSLLIDSMSYKDVNVNERVTLFVKLFGHETRGGSCFMETQAINDNHYAIKRSISKYIFIHSLTKCIPFFLVFRVRELMYCEDVSTNTFNSDIEDDMKLLIVPKSVWKKFDCYCYSYFTDSLPINNKTKKLMCDDSLKAKNIISFKNWLSLNMKLNESEVKENGKQVNK